MGKWGEFRVGNYRLGQLNGEACAVWWERDGAGRHQRHRYRLGVSSEKEGRAALAVFARSYDRLAAERT